LAEKEKIMETIGIIGAMDEEIALFLPQLKEQEQMQWAGITFTKGYLHEKPVVLVKSGVGKVNASVCTQILIDRFGVKQIVFTGVAGALHPDLEIGDIVISTDCMQHDMDVTPLGFSRGEIPFFPQSVFPADKDLIALAQKVSERVIEGKVMLGRILSGDQFVADRERVKELHMFFGGTCTEMEGAAVAQVAYMNQVPFVIIRSMSDKADGSAHVNFSEFTHLAAKRSYEIVEKMIQHL
jgi:adenosylhomocysteine nucleosidase